MQVCEEDPIYDRDDSDGSDHMNGESRSMIDVSKHLFSFSFNYTSQLLRLDCILSVVKMVNETLEGKQR
jgi:hypothetical protein